MRTIFLLAAFVGVGCGSGNPITRLDAQYTETVAAVCDACPGAGTPAECRDAAAAANPFDDPAWVCQRDVYDRYPSQLAPYYDCVLRAVDAYHGCVRGRLSTCPPDVTACNDAQSAAIRACPLPDSIEAGTALAMCFSG